MKILVTGATGFIGRSLLLALAEGEHKIWAVSRHTQSSGKCNNITWIDADLTKVNWLEQLPSQIDVVIHLAQSRHYREFPDQLDDIFHINVTSTVQLANWARNHGAQQFIYASSGNVYGSNERILKEDDPCHPDSMYGASKLSAELLLKPFSQYFNVTVLRLFGVYGPGQSGTMIPTIIKRFIHGQEITLAENIGVKFNPIYIDDCVAVIQKVMDLKTGTNFEVLNVGGPEIFNLKQLTDELEIISQKTASIRQTTEKPTSLVGSTGKLKGIIKVEDFLSIKAGLEVTYQTMLASEKNQ